MKFVFTQNLFSLPNKFTTMTSWAKTRKTTTCDNKEQDKAVVECKDNTTCGICLEQIVNPSSLSCKHVFCSECIIPWLQKGKRSCPTCRDTPKSYDSDSSSNSVYDYDDSESEDNQPYYTDATCWRTSKEMRTNDKMLNKMHNTYGRNNQDFIQKRHTHAVTNDRLRAIEKKCEDEIDAYVTKKYAEFDKKNARLISRKKKQWNQRMSSLRKMLASKRRIIDKTRKLIE